MGLNLLRSGHGLVGIRNGCGWLGSGEGQVLVKYRIPLPALGDVTFWFGCIFLPALGDV